MMSHALCVVRHAWPHHYSAAVQYATRVMEDTPRAWRNAQCTSTRKNTWPREDM